MSYQISAGEPAIVISDVSVCYRLPTERINPLWKEQVIRQITRRKIRFNEFWALRRVNLRIQRGEAIALVGRNGAGKSTFTEVDR